MRLIERVKILRANLLRKKCGKCNDTHIMFNQKGQKTKYHRQIRPSKSHCQNTITKNTEVMKFKEFDLPLIFSTNQSEHPYKCK